MKITMLLNYCLIGMVLCLIQLNPLNAQEKKQAEVKEAIQDATKQLDPLKIQQALEKKITFDFVETPLDDVMKFCSKVLDIPIVISQRALDDEGIPPDSPIFIKLRGVSAKSGFKLILDPLGLTYQIKGENLFITTKTEAEESLETRLYPVLDLILPKNKAIREASDLNFDPLIDALTSLVVPQNWDDVGGAGSIQPFRTFLIVSQTQHAHEQIEEFLSELRRLKNLKPGEEKKGATPDPIEVALQKRIEIDIHELSLTDFAELLRFKLKIPVQINHRALDDEGIPIDSPITMKLQGKAADVIEFVLKPLGLTYLNKNEVLLITTQSESEADMLNKFYIISDLDKPIVANTLENGFFGRGSGVVEIISSTVAPQTWDDVGGRGSLVKFNNILVVQNTQSVHAQVEKLLTQLREQVAQEKIQVEPVNPNEVSIRFYKLAFPGVESVRPAPTSTNADPAPQENSRNSVTMKQVTETLPKLIESNTWRVNGGKGEVQSIGDVLIVKQTHKVHGEIEIFLKQMQAKLNNPISTFSLGGGGFFSRPPK